MISQWVVCCRVDHSEPGSCTYIMTLGCLASYRRLGIGTKMLNHVLNICEKDGTFDNIYLHVQISNESGNWLYRKFGFEIIETKKNYYKRIEPGQMLMCCRKTLKSLLGRTWRAKDRDNWTNYRWTFLALACRQIKRGGPLIPCPSFLLKLSPLPRSFLLFPPQNLLPFPLKKF